MTLVAPIDAPLFFAAITPSTKILIFEKYLPFYHYPSEMPIDKGFAVWW
jgi:hypothetical protein